jgi:hypothetical protein
MLPENRHSSCEIGEVAAAMRRKASLSIFVQDLPCVRPCRPSSRMAITMAADRGRRRFAVKSV